MTTQFVPFTCPSCGGDMMLAADLAQATCNYCGKPFLVSREGGSGPVPSADTLMNLAATAFDAGNMTEAYTLFSRVIELTPSSYSAWFGKGQAAIRLSTQATPRLEEAERYLSEALRLAPIEKQPQIEFPIREELLMAYVLYILNDVLEFRKVQQEAMLVPQLFDKYKPELDRLWPAMIKRIMPWFARLNTLLPDVDTPKFTPKAMAALSDTCDFLLEGVPSSLRAVAVDDRYLGPAQFVPIAYHTVTDEDRKLLLCHRDNLRRRLAQSPV